MVISTDGLLLLVIIVLLHLFNDACFYCSSEYEQLITSISFAVKYLIGVSQSCFGRSKKRTDFPPLFGNSVTDACQCISHSVPSSISLAFPSRFKSLRRRPPHLLVLYFSQAAATCRWIPPSSHPPLPSSASRRFGLLSFLVCHLQYLARNLASTQSSGPLWECKREINHAGLQKKKKKRKNLYISTPVKYSVRLPTCVSPLEI